jgi:hypothetical protein
MYDHYNETHELASMLLQEGLCEYHDALLQAMQEGATGTEIFFNLLWVVKKVLDEGKCSEVCAIKSRRLFNELSAALE